MTLAPVPRALRRSWSVRCCLAVLACAGMLLGGPPDSIGAGPAAPGTIDRFPSDKGAITVSQVQPMSVVIQAPGAVIYTDPTRGKAWYGDHPVPDLILVSHEHHEHFDAKALEEIAGPHTRIVVPPYVMARMPSSLASRAVALANGQTSRLGPVQVEAIAAHGLQGESARWHPPGRGNGYVVRVDGRRLYIAGSTDATPDMLQLRNITIAFLPLYPPYALGVDDAVRAVTTFRPEVTYIYQYNNVRTRNDFVRKMRAHPAATTVIARDIDS